MKVGVVIPTIGSEHLENCVASVLSQSYSDITVYIFVDGKEYHDKINLSEHDNIKYIKLDENVGKGWYGHRVYSACSFLTNTDIICYLDEDNWFAENHVKTLVEKIVNGNDWAYSLRQIYDKDGNYLCNDDCESLGKWPTYWNKSVYHIDTSSFAIKRDVAIRIGHTWYGQWGADRQFFHNLQNHFKKFECTGEYSLQYRLDGNPNSVTKEFFDEGNKKQRELYADNKFPWQEKTETIAPGLTITL